MIDVKIQIGKKFYDRKFPENWDELNELQYIFMANKIEGGLKNDRLYVINFLLGFMTQPLVSYPPEIHQLLDNLLKSPPTGKIFIPSNRDFAGPRDFFRNVTISEFAFADTYFNKFLETKQPVYLNRMIACIYRPIDDEGTEKDIRVPFDEALVAKSAKSVAEWSDKIKYAILMNYKMVRGWLEGKFDGVFQKEEVSEEAKPDSAKATSGGGGDSAKASSPGWDKFIRAMCQGDLTKLEKVKDLLLLNVLAEADEKIKQSWKNH